MAYQMGKPRQMKRNSYELSFSPEFFFSEGEPYDYLGDTKRPVSVWAAVEGMRLHNPEQWAELAKEVFGLDNPEYLTSETVMDKIQETNTCGTLSSPVDVYIDPEGWFSVDVYDDMSRNGMAHLDSIGKLDSFTRGYLEAALWSTNDESREDGGDPLDDNYSIADFAPEAVEKAKQDCARFQQQNARDLEGFDEAEAGADFWFTRNGHGVGYWDGDYPEPQGDRLSKAAKKFGEVWLTVGDDGLIYSS